jgi:hypothetical protein
MMGRVSQNVTDGGEVARADLMRADGAPGNATRMIFDAVRETKHANYALHLRHQYQKEGLQQSELGRLSSC